VSPYQRIMKAALDGRGVRLSAREVLAMSYDSGIANAAVGEWRGDRADHRRDASGKCQDCGRFPQIDDRFCHARSAKLKYPAWAKNWFS